MKTIKIKPINELVVKEFFDTHKKNNNTKNLSTLNVLLDESLLMSLKIIATKLSCPVGQIISSIAECLVNNEEILKETSNENN